MKKIIEYKTIIVQVKQNSEIHKIDEKVNKALQDGWDLYGDIQFDHCSEGCMDVVQVMVKYLNEPQDPKFPPQHNHYYPPNIQPYDNPIKPPFYIGDQTHPDIGPKITYYGENGYNEINGLGMKVKNPESRIVDNPGIMK